MAQLSPMIAIPKKRTEEVDWTTPIRHCISQSYGENPDDYATECAALQRCRQDAVRGAGSDLTARDLQYKYFGQLELLELRFSEIRVNFPWHDAFTNQLITQTSIAYEKASILFLIASTHSSIASSQSRSDPEGQKRAFYYFRSCAGMLTYVNENFLHAPSTDLSREVVKFLISLILAQATEVLFEKSVGEKKGTALVAKIAAQAASMYTTLHEDVKEFMGKGIFEKNWITLIQIKTKLYTSLAHHHRAIVDIDLDKHGDALSRYNLAETLAKETMQLAASFAASFSSTVTPSLPSDTGHCLQELTKTHHSLCAEKRAEIQRANDLIYNDTVPAPEGLPPLEKLSVATPIPIHDVYNAPDVQRAIGVDLFLRLVPLSVHESASVYSEEKAKLVRGEVEKAESAEKEARSALDGLGVRAGLVKYRAMVEGETESAQEVPMEVQRWKDDIALIEERDGLAGQIRNLNRLKTTVHGDLDSISRDLEVESKDCEKMRVQYEHKWAQEPSAGPSRSIRQNLKAHRVSLKAAAASDDQVIMLWDAVRHDIELLLSLNLEQVFMECTGPSGGHLLDLEAGTEAEDAQEKAKIKHYVTEIEDRLTLLGKISKERNEVLKNLRDKIQTDDVSHILLLNRRNTSVEPTLFAAELEKFRPYQQRLAATVNRQEGAIHELKKLWKSLKDLTERGAGARRWEEREKNRKETVRRFSRAKDVYMEVRDGLAKGLQFYNELTELVKTLDVQTQNFVSFRSVDREALVAKLEAEDCLSSSRILAPPPPPKPNTNVQAAFSGMNLRDYTVRNDLSQQGQQVGYGGTSGYLSPLILPSLASAPLDHLKQQREAAQPYQPQFPHQPHHQPMQKQPSPYLQSSQHRWALPPPPPTLPPTSTQPSHGTFALNPQQQIYQQPYQHQQVSPPPALQHSYQPHQHQHQLQPPTLASLQGRTTQQQVAPPNTRHQPRYDGSGFQGIY